MTDDVGRRLCDALAKRGTGLGVCNRPLDENGNCDRAALHLGVDPTVLKQIQKITKENKE